MCLELKRAHTTACLGSLNSGKTTFLNALSGVDLLPQSDGLNSLPFRVIFSEPTSENLSAVSPSFIPNTSILNRKITGQNKPSWISCRRYIDTGIQFK